MSYWWQVTLVRVEQVYQRYFSKDMREPRTCDSSETVMGVGSAQEELKSREHRNFSMVFHDKRDEIES